ncbi:R3H domain-containing nucleic acid-binding protein [Alkalinema sp. FACHB-956]|uniref:R3H domain-containing nucleic acid-binding protein n=1 Tax=Alkalinema sp. FACHB-956 TaxID=2692768 RepID=UPI0016829B36|nr:R3H domain-containing nucleic acid-binding protein [Alkalinema sp. FACHB-956]MBD2326614.1 AAA family ATPase [Alkalinema sp. FACHB-956]
MTESIDGLYPENLSNQNVSNSSNHHQSHHPSDFSTTADTVAEAFETSSVDPAPLGNDGPSSTVVEQKITDDLDKLLEILPPDLRTALHAHPQKGVLVEVVMDLGRQPEARFPGKAEYLSDRLITLEDLQESIQRVGDFGGDNRAGIERTLHRISAIRNRRGDVIGLTCRVGRAVFGTIGMIRDLVESGQSILMLGRPGVGKTTALREIARVLADDLEKRVVIIDTSNEIAGDGDVPHPAIGRARRMQVAQPELQHQVMIEAVENHMPEVIVIDEIGTELEALAARTIAERGVQLVGTAHGNQLENLMKNPTLSDLIGGIQSVTLSDEEARRRGSQKSVLERKAPPTFDIAVEMLERQKWTVHEEVGQTVDMLLRGRQPNPQVRTVDSKGQVVITQESGGPVPIPPKNRPLKVAPLGGQPPYSGSSYGGSAYSNGSTYSTGPVAVPDKPIGWRSSGRMQAISNPSLERREFEHLLDRSLGNAFDGSAAMETHYGANGEELPLQVYPYGIGRHQLDQLITTLNLPIVLTKDIDTADAVLALRSHVKNHSKLRHLAKSRQIPIHTLKSSSIPQIALGLRRLLNMDDPSEPETPDLSLFTRGDTDDELEALEEARLAVEQIVIPKGQPVELLPRSANVRKMQHELVEHYHLTSRSFGDEPNRRIRIYPA